MDNVLKRLHAIARAHDAGATDIAHAHNQITDVLMELDVSETTQVVAMLLFEVSDLVLKGGAK